MYSIYIKEIVSFFASITGCVVIIVFLALTGWFMWLNPGEFNILDSGYANIDTLFFIAPWVFLFLIPAITMRSFAEERKTGTIELLLTYPTGEMQLVVAKYFAAITLILLSLTPCLVYYFTVYFIGNPVGNIDTGGVWGSFVGLFFLASAYASIGIFVSSLTDSQIVAFIVSAVLCFFVYSGFDGIALLSPLKPVNTFLVSMGINEHYKSLSRGVIDLRDLIYFVALISIFIGGARLKLQSRRWQ
ncbi:MAG: gliding motility-associated ABC transporter permease subunit GldF [Prevotellaceae bacterium]|jgi:ABC-2 type transport system permease protein|nr:gliding motility-associated ABC transporter permease subunit GldF [Prevotellaceae bacterium]